MASKAKRGMVRFRLGYGYPGYGYPTLMGNKAAKAVRPSSLPSPSSPSYSMPDSCLQVPAPPPPNWRQVCDDVLANASGRDLSPSLHRLRSRVSTCTHTVNVEFPWAVGALAPAARAAVSDLRHLTLSRAKFLCGIAEASHTTSDQLAFIAAELERAVMAGEVEGVDPTVVIKALESVEAPLCPLFCDAALDGPAALDMLMSFACLRSDVDVSRCVVDGAGLAAFDVAGTDTVSSITVCVYDATGEAVTSVCAADVTMSVAGGRVVSVCEDSSRAGTLILSYCVPLPTVNCITLSVSVCGHPVPGSPWTIHRDVCDASGVLVNSLPLLPKYNCDGLAIAPSGQLVLLSMSGGVLRVFPPGLDLTAEECVAFGDPSARPMQITPLVDAVHHCVTPAGTILVTGVKRVLEMDMRGSLLRVLGEGVVEDAECVAACPSLIAVKYGPNVALFSPLTGDLIRLLSGVGTHKGCEVNRCRDMVFTPDGKQLAVADMVNRHVCLYSTDGVFVRAIGGSTLTRPAGLAWTHSGDLIVSDFWRGCVFVFSMRTGACLRTWGSEGSGDLQLRYPSSLATHGRHLLVLDQVNCRVQVFV